MLGSTYRLIPVLACLLLFISRDALSAGFYLTEIGTPGSLGTAGAANPTNTFTADAAWSNPAGMTGIREEGIMAGAQLVLPKIEFDPDLAVDTGTSMPVSGGDGGNAGAVAAIPSFFYVKPLTERTRFGFSVVAPQGGGFDFDSDYVGRYIITEVQLTGIGFTPSFGYQVNDRLSLGAGISAIYTVLDQELALRQPGMTDATIEFDSLDDWGFQGVLGLTYQLTNELLLGVVYRSEADVELEGDLKIKNLVIPFSPDRDLGVEWDNPQWLDMGLRYRMDDETHLFFNAGWQEWSTFSENTIGVSGTTVATLDRNWDNTWYAGVGMAHQLGPGKLFSLGASYDSSPVSDKHRTLDFALDEIWKLSAAYGWKGKDKFDFAVGATLYLVGDAPVDQTSQGVRVVGDFDTNAILFLGGTLRYQF